MTKLAPSIMAGNHLDFLGEVKQIQRYADIVHLDVMDGHFVPNLGLGVKTCEAICKHSSLPCWTHLMVTNPNDYIEKFGNMKSTAFVWHIECEVDHMKMIADVQSKNMLAGIAISPSTDLSMLLDVSQSVDIITVMGVIPGRSGQKFIPDTFERVSEIRGFSGDFLLEVDGGVNIDNAKMLASSGADVLVSGSSFFYASNEEKEKLSILVRDLRR